MKNKILLYAILFYFIGGDYNLAFFEFLTILLVLISIYWDISSYLKKRSSKNN